MNPNLPPLQFADPIIKSRRAESKGFPDIAYPSPAERSKIAKRVHAEIKELDRHVKELTPEQRRAMFLRMRHDRPLKKADLTGTGLQFMGEPGESESLVILQKPLTDLEQRLVEYERGKAAVLKANDNLVQSIQGLTLGEPADRMSDRFFEQYEALCAKERVYCEIEITGEGIRSSSRRASLLSTIAEVKDFFAYVNGAICDSDLQGEGARLLIWTTGSMLKELVEGLKWQRLVTYFDLRPVIGTFRETFQNFNVEDVTIEGPDVDAPAICVIDSGIADGNPFLQPVLLKDPSRSWVYNASPTEDAYGHGSGVAALAAYHALSIEKGSTNKASAWVASARILTDEGELDTPRLEDDEEDRISQAMLLSTILREIVEHFVAEDIRIFVLSFEMIGHVWSKAYHRQIKRTSWTARTIDQLSRQHNVVFCCISGNIGANDVEDLIFEHGYPNYYSNPLSKLLDPGPAALAVTVGSVANSATAIGDAQTAIAKVGDPSPFTRSGPGLGGAIKPDFVEMGGNLVADNLTGRIASNLGTNVVTASNSLNSPLKLANGTSYAAPRVANHLAQIQRDLEILGINAGNPLLRAFLATSAVPVPQIDGLSSSDHLHVTGYGIPRGETALLCEGHSVLLYWQGEMKADQTAIFKIHVPAELVNVGITDKRIVISAATAPPVQQWGLSDYLGCGLKFWLFRGNKDEGEIIKQLHREEGEKNDPYPDPEEHIGLSRLKITLRTAGTLQCDIFPWKRHKKVHSASDYTLAVALPKNGCKWVREEEIQVAVVVRIEEQSGAFNELYARVQARENARVAARPRAQA